MDNICKFLPTESSREINILHFVYEQKNSDTLRCDSFYKMHLVTQGKGKIAFLGSNHELSRGDIFFTFPSVSYTIESVENLEYMYISYIGARTNELMDRLRITKSNFVFPDFPGLVTLWTDSIINDTDAMALRCEGLLLYSLSVIAEQFLQNKTNENELMLSVKKYIDETFCDGTLSLEKISERYSYNKKYLSGRFKKAFRIGISQYIATLRIQAACTLIEQGFTSVKDISAQCGFSDPFYFSRVFKQKTGFSPREYIQNSPKSKPEL